MPQLDQKHVAAIKAGELHVAQAQDRVEKAARVLALAQSAWTKTTSRIADLDTARAAIVTRRATGDHGPDDGQRLSLIGADREGLVAILAMDEAAVVEAQGPVDAANRALIGARQMLKSYEDAAVEEALAAHAAHLDDLLLETVRRLRVVTKGTPREARPPYGPSQPLRDELRRLSLFRGEM